MLVFIDESGDVGFKIGKGSSNSFVMALIIFDSEEDAYDTALKIKNLHKRLNKTSKFEFKFNKCDKRLRLAFLNEVKGCNFKIRAAVFHKDKIYNLKIRSSNDYFYNYALKHVLGHGDFIVDARIKLDGSGNKKFRTNLVSYLKKNLNIDGRKVVNNLRFCDSKENVLIQLADMVAGSLRREFDQKGEDLNPYREILKKKEDNIWEN